MSAFHGPGAQSHGQSYSLRRMLSLLLPLGTIHHICSSYPSSCPLLNKKLQEILTYTFKSQNKGHTRLRYPNNTTMITLGKFKNMINMLKAPMDKGEHMKK